MEKFYWLKLKRDFFKRHDIRIVETMPNGKDYILFYLKLLCESLDHNGNLRFSDEIPYNEDMLATITNTNVDIVRSAIKIFTELKMMEKLDNGTYYMNEVEKLIGSVVNNDNANRQRAFREKQKQLALQDCYGSVTKSNENKNIELELELKENSIKNTTKEKVLSFGTYNRIKLTQTQYDRLVNEKGKDFIDDIINKLDEYVQSNDNKNKYKDFNLVIRKAIRENWFTKKKESAEPSWLKEYKEHIEDGVEML